MATWKLKIQGTTNDILFNSETDVSDLGKVKLVSLNIQKEVYVPGHIEAVLQVRNNKFEEIDFTLLLEKNVTLNDGTNDIAKDYIIFECLPEYKPSGDKTSFYLTLSIYSPEHCLTFKKGNKCYIAEKLADGIFRSIASDHTDKIKNIEYAPKRIITSSGLEFIQPYLVQFEETELNFLSRIANECGEFMYYERGAWHLGIKSNDTNIGNYDSMSFKKLTSNEAEEEEMVVGTKEEYLDTLTESVNEYTGEDLLKRLAVTSVDGWLFNIGNWSKKANLAEIALAFEFDAIKNIAKGKVKLNEQNDKWNEVHIKPYMGNKEQCKDVNDKKMVCPFSNYDAKSKFGKAFYQQIRKEEKAASKKKIHINFGTNYTSLLLCDKFKELNVSYVISKISITCKYMDDVKGTYTNLEIEALPMSADGTFYPPLLEGKTAPKVESQVGIITANNDPWNLGRVQFRYPWQKDSSKPYSPWVSIAQPFASDDAGIRFMPQIGDEIMLGYEHGRIDRPFMIGGLATKQKNLSLGMNKIATVENAVPNTYLDNAKSGYNNNDFIIKSPNGQYIKFLAPSNENFMNSLMSFFPCVKTFLSFTPGSWDYITYTPNIGKKFSGGINIGDAYGLFNINMSTEKRKVLISSALGDVQIDAYTGITISAPNGNVKIEGKNVEIVAGNNLTLKSGTNVDKMKKLYSKNAAYALMSSVSNTVVDEAKKLLQAVDLKLLRTICDAVVKPVGGTMLLKSKRYLRLEAGKGSTALPNKAYEKGSRKQAKVLKAKINEMKVMDVINATVNLMKWYETNFAEANLRFKEAINAYKNHINLLKIEMRNFIKLGGKVKYNNADVQEAGIVNDNFDTVNAILGLAKEKNKQLAEVHPKLDKFAFELGTTDRYRLNRVTQHLDNAVIAAERIACEIQHYFSTINDMDKNVGAKIQRDIINIADKSILTLSDKVYKNEIFHYLSTNVEGNNDALLNVPINENEADGFENVNVEYAGQNIDSNGVIHFIHMYLPKEIKLLENFGQAGRVTIDRIRKRKNIYMVIQVLKKANLVTIENEDSFLDTLMLDHEANTSVLDSDSVCENTNKWKKYLDCVKPYEEKSVLSTLSKIAEKLDYLGAKDIVYSWEEDVLYNPEVEGEILLSDTGGNTCKISGEKISSTPTSDVKAAIRSLKEI